MNIKSINNIAKSVVVASILIGNSMSAKEISLGNNIDYSKTLNHNSELKLKKGEYVIDKLYNLSKIEDENIRNFFIEQFVNDLAKVQKRYNQSIIDYPNVNNLKQQVNAILNSNLIELCDSRILKTYSRLKESIKFKDSDKVYRNIVLNTIEQIELLTIKLDRLNLNPHNTILEITHNVPYKDFKRNGNEFIKNKIYENDFAETLKYFVETDKEDNLTKMELEVFKNYLILSNINTSKLSDVAKSFIELELSKLEDNATLVLNDFIQEHSIGLNDL